MPRCPQQQGIGLRLAQQTMGIQHRRFLVLVRARRDPHRAGARAMRGELGREGCGIDRRHVELQVAADLHALRLRAEHDEAVGVVARLRGHQPHRAQRAADQRGEHAVAAQRTRRQPRVEDVGGNATVAAAEQQVRPQLGFHDQRQRRAEMVEEAADRTRQVVRQVDVGDRIAPQGAHALGTGRGDGGDHQAQVRSQLAQSVHQGSSGIDLADRHRMQPQRRRRAALRIVRVALAPAMEVRALAEAAPDQVVQGDRDEHVQRGRIEAAQDAFGEVGPHRDRIAKPPAPVESPG